MNINKHFTISFIDILTVIYCGFCVLELNTETFKYICLVLLFFWVGVAFLTNRKVMQNLIFNKGILLLLVYALICFLYAAFVRNMIFGLKYAFSIIISESPFMLYLFYEKKKKTSDFTKLLPWIEFTIVLLLCKNILGLIATDPNAARKMAAATNVYQNYLTGGGYQIAYALCLLVPFLFVSFKRFKQKIAVIIFIAVFTYTLIKCSYTIAILLAVFELLLLLLFRNKKISRSKRIATICFICAIVMLYVLRNPIGDLFVNRISPLFSEPFVKRRMAEFGQFLKGEAGITNGAASRIEYYGYSIRTFINSPIIGISYLTKFMSDLEADLNGIRYLSLHSTIFDGFARIGFLFVLYVIYYWKALCYIAKKLRTNYIMIVGTILFMIKVLNVGDAFGMSYIVFFAIPMICKSFEKNNLSAHDSVKMEVSDT